MGTINYCLFLFAFCLASLCFGQKKVVYDIYDPRNPSCPCHKLQRLADEEHSRKIKQSKTPDNIGRDEKGHRIYLNGGKRKSFKKRLNKIQNIKFRHSKKNLFRKKVRTDYSVCFKW